MRNPHGCVTVFDGTNARGKSADTITCCHCGMVYEVPDTNQQPLAELGGRDPAPSFCTLCCDFYCPLCIGKACDPFEKKLKRLEDADRQRRALDRVLQPELPQVGDLCEPSGWGSVLKTRITGFSDSMISVAQFAGARMLRSGSFHASQFVRHSDGVWRSR